MAALCASFLCAAILAFTVYGAVSYDSSKDPVVAQSYMEQYVGDQLSSVKKSISDLSNRIAVVELTGGGGGGSGSGEGMSGQAAQQILSQISELQAELNTLKTENATLKQELNTAKNDLRTMIDELQGSTSTLKTEISNLKNDIAAVRSQISGTQQDVETLQKNFKQISDISTKLSIVSSIVNDEKTGVSALNKELQELTLAYNEMQEEMGKTYKVVEVPVGATVRAKDPEDTLLLILRSGSAKVISPYTTPGQQQGLNDLTNGTELLNGAAVPLYHSILIPRGGNDGRAIRIDGVDNAYLMIGGVYEIVEP